MTTSGSGAGVAGRAGAAHRVRTLAHRAALLVFAAQHSGTRRGLPKGEPSQTLEALSEALSGFPRGDDPPITEAALGQALDAAAELAERCQTVLAPAERGEAPVAAALSDLARFFFETVAPALDELCLAADKGQAERQREMQDLLFRDRLTGLSNGLAAEELDPDTLLQADRLLVIRLDLERLAALREAVGRPGRDEALLHTARTLQSCAEPKAFIARIEDGAFLLVQAAEGTPDDQKSFVEALVERLNQPFEHEGGQYQLGASAGLATGPGERLGHLIEEAELALLAAKGSARDGARLFSPDLRRHHRNVGELIDQLKASIEARTFEPYFQPQVEGRSGKLVGLEALIRWPHPSRGMLAPPDFLPVAERAELLDQLDSIMLDKVLEAAGRWRKQGLDVPRISINLSEARLFDPDIVEVFRWAAERNALPPEAIGIEILESVMLEGRNRHVARIIQELSDIGFRIELDDFGTGHASIAKLRNLRVDRIKIDRSFVRNIHLSSELSKITGAMIGLAHSMRVDALAEGVETPEERLVLNALGCDHIQGFGVAEPISEADIPDWIARTQNTGPRRRVYRLRAPSDRTEDAPEAKKMAGKG